jgi:hypothetical protein
MDYELEEKLQNLKSNEEIEATYRKKKKSLSPPYITVGNGVATKKFPSDVVMDAFEVFGNLTKARQSIFKDFKDIWVRQAMDNHYSKRKVDNPNLIQLDRHNDNELHQRIKTRMMQNRNGSELERSGILKKIKNRQYMLNPYIFIPAGDFEKVAEIWEGLPTK